MWACVAPYLVSGFGRRSVEAAKEENGQVEETGGSVRIILRQILWDLRLV